MGQEIQYINENSIVITLSELKYDEIPDTLWDSLNINELKIQKSLPDGIWTTQPPLTWFENREIKPPYWSVPEGLTKLKNLEVLYLVNLDIKELPDSITKLQKLKVLDLSFNKLQLSDEVK